MVNYNLQNLDSITINNHPNTKIKPIEFSFSLGSLWDDGEGSLGYDIKKEDRLTKS